MAKGLEGRRAVISASSHQLFRNFSTDCGAANCKLRFFSPRLDIHLQSIPLSCLASPRHSIPSPRQNLTILDSKSGTLRGLGRLESVAGVLWINNASIVSTAGLVSLQRVGGIRIAGSNAALESVSFPSLTTVSDYLNINNNGALAALFLPALRSVGGFLVIDSNGLSE